MLLSSPQVSKSLKDVFYCPEESNFYANCLELLILNDCIGGEVIVEFGSGDGSPVIKSLTGITGSKFKGAIHGFEINNLACQDARAKIRDFQLSSKYIIHNQCLFTGDRISADYLISNPPYLPAIDNQIYQPNLHGGIDGITITKKLLDLNYENALMMVSSYGNPQGLIDYAASKGYYVANFMISPLNFGYYSSEPKVKNRIAELKRRKQAFYSENIYLLAGILFKKRRTHNSADISKELLKLMMAL